MAEYQRDWVAALHDVSAAMAHETASFEIPKQDIVSILSHLDGEEFAVLIDPAGRSFSELHPRIVQYANEIASEQRALALAARKQNGGNGSGAAGGGGGSSGGGGAQAFTPPYHTRLLFPDGESLQLHCDPVRVLSQLLQSGWQRNTPLPKEMAKADFLKFAWQTGLCYTEQQSVAIFEALCSQQYASKRRFIKLVKITALIKSVQDHFNKASKLYAISSSSSSPSSKDSSSSSSTSGTSSSSANNSTSMSGVLNSSSGSSIATVSSTAHGCVQENEVLLCKRTATTYRGRRGLLMLTNLRLLFAVRFTNIYGEKEGRTPSEYRIRSFPWENVSKFERFNFKVLMPPGLPCLRIYPTDSPRKPPETFTLQSFQDRDLVYTYHKELWVASRLSACLDSPRIMYQAVRNVILADAVQEVQTRGSKAAILAIFQHQDYPTCTWMHIKSRLEAIGFLNYAHGQVELDDDNDSDNGAEDEPVLRVGKGLLSSSEDIPPRLTASYTPSLMTASNQTMSMTTSSSSNSSLTTSSSGLSNRHGITASDGAELLHRLSSSVPTPTPTLTTSTPTASSSSSSFSSDYRSFDGAHGINAFELSRELLACAVALFFGHTTDLSSDPSRSVFSLNFESLCSDPELDKLRLLASRLNTVRTDNLSPVELVCFFINVYNALIIDAIISCGTFPTNSIDWQVLCRYAYYLIGMSPHSPNIGERSHAYSLLDILHGVLRDNTTPAWLRTPIFPASDPRLRAQSVKFDPRIHFLLCHHTAISPPVWLLSPTRFDEQLHLAHVQFIQETVAVDVDHGRIVLPLLLETYAQDFGGESTILHQWVMPQVDRATRSKIEIVLQTSQFEIIYQDDWSFSTKPFRTQYG